MNFRIYENLAWLNDLHGAEAENVFLGCCKSNIWAHRMAEARPFALVDDIFESAKRIWFSLSEADRWTVFADKSDSPAIAPDCERPTQAANDQAGAKKTVDPVFDEMIAAKRLYEDKFGFIFVINVVGKTADEILSICRARLGNSFQTEMTIAAGEQLKIIEARLANLLEK